MKDSHVQTVQDCEYCGPVCYRGAGHNARVEDNARFDDATIVQDYREYTAEEILHGILESTEQAGWGDPANLGHWLGAAQRWALKERV